MLSKWPIRNKLLFGLALLLVMVSTLAYSAFYGLYAYRDLVKSLGRVSELRYATELGQHVGALRVGLSRLRVRSSLQVFSLQDAHEPLMSFEREEFRQHLAKVRESLADYDKALTAHVADASRIANNQRERAAVADIENRLRGIDQINQDEDWVLNEVQLDKLDRELDELQKLTADLPGFLRQSIQDFTDDVRTQRRSFVAVAWATTIASFCMLAAIMRLFYKWIFRPLRVLVKGSRKVAGGCFEHRIVLDTQDEMAELADAMNDMTARFRTIRDDLDRQVQVRTRQVVRSEQLASVGFLAAGVAHEINNPLASIAMCAESLEGRAADLVREDDPQYAVVTSYLRMIQEQAFRCKEITSKLLDFSRLGDVKRQPAELRQLVQGVVDMVGHVGKYQGKRLEFLPGDSVTAEVNSQEINQVVLNLVTNALESLDDGGRVTLKLERRREQAVLEVVDDGCGMTPEVSEHLFEPFFTRRRGGQGTGLGLSITFRIVEEHGGRIEAASDGPGRGSTFRVLLPLVAHSEQEAAHGRQAA